MRRLLLSLSLCALVCAPVYAQRSDTDDGSVPGGKTSVTVTIGESYLWNGAAWVRLIGDATNGLKVQCASGCAGGTTDNDDGTIAGAQTPNLNIAETYVWDGAAWKRLTIGTAGTPSAQVVSVQGVSGGLRIPVTLQDSTGAAIATSDGGAGASTGNTTRGIQATDSPDVVTLGSTTDAAAAAGGTGSLSAKLRALTAALNGNAFTVTPAAGTLKSGAITSAMTGTTSTAVIAAQASNYLYVTSCAFSNTHASVTTMMLLQDGSGGTTLWEGVVPFGGGSNVTFPVPLKVPTLGNALYTQNVTTGSNTFASSKGFYTTVSY